MLPELKDSDRREITEVLRAWRLGSAEADELAPLVYQELRRQARHYMARERPGHLLQPTALIHEAFIRILDLKKVDWANRDQFFAASAQLMRRILVDAARRERAEKRGGRRLRVSPSEVILGTPPEDLDLLALDEALTALSRLDPRKTRVVELRFFGGLTVEETAGALGISPETVMRDWRFARVWLLERLKQSGGIPDPHPAEPPQP